MMDANTLDNRRIQAENEMVAWGEMHAKRDDIIMKAAITGFSASDIAIVMGISRNPVIKTMRENGLGHLIQKRGPKPKGEADHQ